MIQNLLTGTRREVILGAASLAIVNATRPAWATQPEVKMATFTTRDDVTIYYKDWGPRDGDVVILSHGWPLNADSWESQAFHLASNGCRVITHDRRGHGRSSQPWDGNDMDHYADDLAQLIEQLDLRNVSLFGFSTGGGEVARYVGRHGTDRVARIGLVSAVPPIMLRTESNPIGLPIEVFDGFRAASVANRAKLYRDIASGPFFRAALTTAPAEGDVARTSWDRSAAGRVTALAQSTVEFTPKCRRLTLRPAYRTHANGPRVRASTMSCCGRPRKGSTSGPRYRIDTFASSQLVALQFCQPTPVGRSLPMPRCS